MYIYTVNWSWPPNIPKKLNEQRDWKIEIRAELGNELDTKDSNWEEKKIPPCSKYGEKEYLRVYNVVPDHTGILFE